LIGMNTAIISPSGASAGIGFAIPVDTINQVVPALIDPTNAPPRMGVSLRDNSPADSMVMVESVFKGTGADEAGVVGEDATANGYGDVIVAVDGKTVHRSADVQAAIAGKKRGDFVDLVVVRGLPAREQRVQLK